MIFKLFPRAHLTLIGFNKDSYRKFGGAGFSFSEPHIELIISESKNNSLVYFFLNKKIEYDNRRLINILDALCAEFKFHRKLQCIVNAKCPPHSGFGTGTNISLACVEALLIINEMEYDANKLIDFSKRGRTSGIGIQTYFNGGFAMDCGVKNLDNVFLPSNQNESREIAKPFLVCEMPEWTFLICIPRKIRSLTSEEENSFFGNNTPLTDADVEKIIYITVYGLCVSVIESDFQTFCKSVNDIQETRWKRLERNNFGNDLKRIEDLIFKSGAQAVGMSSLGPSLIAFSDNIETVRNNLNAYNDEVITVRANGNNSGRIIYA